METERSRARMAVVPSSVEGANVRWIGWIVGSVLAVTRKASPAAEPSYHNDPVASYDHRRSHGFTVLISSRLREHQGDAVASWDELDRQLGEIARVVPAGPLGRLRQVVIWLEWAETAGLGEFHWGEEALIAAGRNPAKARGVEITNARHLVAWSAQQPWALLHELAHAYHCVVLGRADGAVVRAYKQAVRSGRYARVAYIQGGERVAYALVNSKEYFAELTEAYFGRNDFEPFTRGDLARFDPPGHQLMVEVWGIPVSREKPVAILPAMRNNEPILTGPDAADPFNDFESIPHGRIA